MGAERTVVSIAQSTDNTAAELLERALETSCFWEILETARSEAEVPAEAFRILIKPDMEVFDENGTTGTDPALVEHLIDLLMDCGYEQVAIAEGVGEADLWLENRDVLVLADLAGYRYETPRGRPYDIIDLSEDVVDAGFPEESVLHRTELSQVWLDAHFRISVAKNKTDEAHYYALGMESLLRVLPLRDKIYHYNHRLRPEEAGADLLRHTPVHFSVIDAVISNHGSQGTRARHALPTGTVIAAPGLLLADWVAALKMDLDPYASPLNGAALGGVGLPASYRIEGDLTPYPGWINVPILLAESVRKRNENVYIERLVRPWLQSVNTEVFPFKHPIDAQVNAFLAPMLKDPDTQPLAYWVMVGLNYAFAGLHQMLEAWQIMVGKAHLRRKEVSLGMDLEAYKKKDYDQVIPYIESLEQIARLTPPDRNGLRWRYIDGSVLFVYSRVIPAPFEAFVDRMDISKAVQLMYDNIGGACVPVRTDRKGRVVQQAERNLYLPQPNWMVLYGGDCIDVGKLETIRYQADRHQIFWRTVTSANGSAEFDDGLVTFARHDGGVEVSIIARQKFTLPLFWQVINLDYVPEFKDQLVSDAYVRFFSRTMANFEAAYEDRPVPIGQEWDLRFGEDGTVKHPLDVDQVKGLLSFFTGLIARWTQQPGASPQPTGHVDEQGYRHFPAKHTGPAAPETVVNQFLKDLTGAVGKDIRWYMDPSKRGAP